MSLEACSELLQRGDPDRFLAAMAAPPEARARLLPLYAFNLEVARAPWASAEPLIAEMRLQFWHDVVEAIAEGRPPPGHEVTGPLAAVLEETPLGAGPLLGIVDARRRDCHATPFADEQEFADHIDATSGNLFWAAARALGAPETAEPVVRDFAWGAGLANWLRAVPELEARGHWPLVDGRPAAVAALAREGLSRISAARRRAAEIPPAARPALQAGWRARPVLRMAASAPERVAEGRLVQSEFARRGGLLWLTLIGRW
ncbi:phytoene synthase [Rhodobacteraceae bacterium WD3A24]|nr:phytoene synthase [Rhodobacteraceae bacterium WD3A24]